MYDFQRVTFSQENRTIGVPRDDFAISLHHDPRLAYLKLLQQASHAESFGNLFLFSVEFKLHVQMKKTASTTATPKWPGNTVSSVSRRFSSSGTLTLTLPYAGATRIRFEGLPATCQALSLPQADTPSIESTLNRAIMASQINAAVASVHGTRDHNSSATLA